MQQLQCEIGDDFIKKQISVLLSLFISMGLVACANGKDNGALKSPSSLVPSVFDVQSSGSVPSSAAQPSQAQTQPSGAKSPLTGLAIAEELTGKRPLAVVVDNSAKGLPQRGLSSAEVLIEMPVENNQTRLLAFYTDFGTLPQVGPVRPIADQFVQMILPTNAIPVHIGSTQYAENLLAVANYKSIDGFTTGKTAFIFDDARNQPKPDGKRNEFCWFTSAEYVWNGMVNLDVITTGETPNLFTFNYGEVSTGTDALLITVKYTPEMTAAFVYDAQTANYSKQINSVPHLSEDGTALKFQNVLLLSTSIGFKADDYHMPEFDMTAGTGYYFVAGKSTEIKWIKGNSTAPLQILNTDGQALAMQAGSTYIGFAPLNAEEPAIVFASEIAAG